MRVQSKEISAWAGRAKDGLLKAVNLQAQGWAVLESWGGVGGCMFSERTKAELQVRASTGSVEGWYMDHVRKTETRLKWLLSNQVWGASKITQSLCLRRKMIKNSLKDETPEWLSGWVYAFGSGCDPGFLGSSPTSGSGLSRESFSLSFCPFPSPPYLYSVLSLSQIKNK